ncbi:MAG: DUF4836 family protein [Prevotellaceae bacterium]|jgi:hypothetical protein|nr:DUF4836 family protein [Prevotellaceae bacterium]
MKKLNYIVLLTMIALATFSCAKKDSLATSIPENAMMVMRVDVKSMAQKAEYSLFENEKIKASLGMLKAAIDNSNQKKLLDNFLKNPNSFGINLLGDAYFFVSADGTGGVVFAVNDAKRLYNNISVIDSGFSRDIIQKDGSYSFISNTGSYAWNKNRFVAVINLGSFVGFGETATMVDANKFLNLSKAESFAGTEAYKKFSLGKNDIAAFYSMKYYMDALEQLSLYSQNQNLFVFEALKGVYQNYAYSVVGSINFEKGKIVSKATMLFDTPEIEKRYKALKSYNSPITGDLNNFIPANPIFCVAAHLEGKNIIEDINAQKISVIIDSISKEINFDLYRIINVFNGDIVVSLNHIDFTNEDMPVAVSLFAKIDPAALNSLLDSLTAKNADIKRIDNHFVFGECVAGFKGDVFYLMTNDADYQKFIAGGEQNPAMDKLKGQVAFVGGDFKVLKDDILPALAESMYSYIANEGLSLIDTYESKAPQGSDTFEFVVNFTGKDKNSLASIFKFIDNAINNIPLY